MTAPLTETGTDEAVELHKADIPRVDAVAGPAHGLPFLIAKSLEDGGPEAAALLAKALGDDNPSDAVDGLAETEVVKESAVAVEMGNGVQAHGEVGTSTADAQEQAMRVATQTAEQLHTDQRQGELANNAQVTGTVVKAEDGAGADVPIPAVPEQLVPVAPGAGSPAWEAADAANLGRATSLLVELKQRLEAAREREWAEVCAGAEDDADTAWALDDVVWTLDYLLGVVAKITVEEQAEAGALDDTVMKSATRTVAAITALGHPATNLKETAVADNTNTPVEKADVVGVYPVTGSGGTSGGPEGTDSFVTEAGPTKEQTDGGPEGEDSFEKGPDADASAPHGPSVTKSSTEAPAAPVDVASEIAKALSGDQVGTVLKGIVEGAVQAKLEPVAKAVEDLQSRLETVEKQPMPGGPMLRGAGTPNQEWLIVKGQQAQPNGSAALDTEQVAKALESISDPVERDQMGRALAKAQHPLHQG